MKAMAAELGDGRRARAGRVELTRLLGADPTSRRPLAGASSSPHPRPSSLSRSASHPRTVSPTMVPLPGKRHRPPTELDDQEDHDFDSEGLSNRRDSVNRNRPKACSSLSSNNHAEEATAAFCCIRYLRGRRR